MRMILTTVIAGVLLCAGGCDKKQEDASGVGNALDAAKDAASDTFTKLRDQAVAAIEPRLEEARGQIATLKEKLAGVPDAVKPTLESGMAEVDKQLSAAGEQLTKLKDAGADTWQSISTELGAAVDKLGAAIKDLTGKFPS